MLARRLAKQGLVVPAGTLAVVLAQSTASACWPPSVLHSTLRAVTLFAVGKPVGTNLISAKVAGLTHELLKTMLLTKVKLAAGVLFAVGLVVAAAGESGLIDRLRAAQNVHGQQSNQEAPTRHPRGEPDRKETGSDRLSDERQRRVLRWVLSFDWQDGNQYAKQLEALGAIVAVPSEKPGQYRVFRDLAKHPAQSTVEDLAKLQHIFWVENNVRGIRSLSGALGLQRIPQQIVILLPRYVEDELLRKELAHARREEKTIEEKDIGETRFKFFRAKTGFEIEVVCQVLQK
jgi:hypothetical protein